MVRLSLSAGGMSGVCTAITHTGARCASPATDSAVHCAHHARMARVMALAPKASTASSSASNGGSSTASGSIQPAPSAANGTGRLQETRKELGALHLGLNRQGSASSVSSFSSSSSSAFTAPLQPPAASSSATTSSGLQLLDGEAAIGSIACSFVFPQALGLPDLPGALSVSNYRLRFEPQNPSLRSPGYFHRLLDDAIAGMPRASVAKLSYPQSTAPATRAAASRYDSSAVLTRLVVKFKDLRAWTLSGDVSSLMLALNRRVFVDSPLSLFAFAHVVADGELEQRAHAIYNLERDFARMGVPLRSGGSAFRVSDANGNYSICATYPPRFVVPASISDHEVASVAGFRSKGRLPICCFVHPRNSASIWRCAQPKRGILHAQNAADDRYLARIAASNVHQQRVWIADCRPELNARVNNLTGGGTESSSIPHARVSFLNIGNIHAMRESIDNIRALVQSAGGSELDLAWGSRVEDTRWLAHVRLVLSGALRVAEAVENKGTTVLVHCSDGWDRTGQLCGLSQILLDGHYRTIEGFIDVVEKEWVTVGHKFHDRVGPGVSENDEQAPIFLQFLDCVWQLQRQYPTHFEFNARLLETIVDALFSARFGTFLGNCDRERRSWRWAERTRSLWAHVLRHRAAFANPFFRERTDRVLLPPASSLLRHVTLWTEYFFRGSTMPVIPSTNPSAPPFASPSTASNLSTAMIPPAKAGAHTGSDDLAASMNAAVERIRALEEELRELRASSYAVQMPPPIVPPSPSPIVYAAPVAPAYSVSPAPAAASVSGSSVLFPTPTPSSSLSSASVSASSSSSSLSASGSGYYHTNGYTPASNGTAAGHSMAWSSSSWTCAICTKVNASESVTCVVCGRAPR